MSYDNPPPPPPPPAYGAQPPTPGGTPPPTNLVWGILSTVLCCLPFGIVSIVYAAQVNGKWAAGDHAGAQKSSDNAKKWALISAGIGLVVGVIYLIAVVAAGGNS